jgi:hypothetical protein
MPSAGLHSGVVDFHYPAPQWDDQSPSTSECPYTDGDCYSDCGFLIADELLGLLRIKGDDAVWARLRELLNDVGGES